MEHYLLNILSVHYLFCHKYQSLAMARSAFLENSHDTSVLPSS